MKDLAYYKARCENLLSRGRQPARRRAREILRRASASAGSQGGEHGLLDFYVKLYQSLSWWPAFSEDNRRSRLIYEAEEKRRDRALAKLDDAANELLRLYDAPEHSLQWQTVYVSPMGTPTDGVWTTIARKEHAARLRATLEALKSDPVFRSRPQQRKAGRPRSGRQGTLRMLRRLGLSRDDALTLIAAACARRTKPFGDDLY